VGSDGAQLDQHAVVVVFLGSPGGLDDDRTAVKDAAAEVNQQLRQFNIQVELCSGETHGPAGGRPQDDINADVDRCHIFIGLVWDTWGSPSGAADSGFEEEYRRVAERRDAGGGSWPQPLLWFKDVPAHQQEDPGPKLQKVLDFRQELIDGKAEFFRDYETLSELAGQVRIRLFEVIVELTGINEPSPESLQGIDIGDRPPRSAPPAPAVSRPSPINWGAALTAGPVDNLPRGRERAEQATSLEGRDPAAAAALLEELAAELAERRAEIASEDLWSRAATAYWAAGRAEQAIAALLTVLRVRVRRSSEQAAVDVKRLRQWLREDQGWQASAWEACTTWPERLEDARAALAGLLAEHSEHEVAREDWLYWRLVLSELHLLAGYPADAMAIAATDSGAEFETREQLLLLLTGIEAEEHCNAANAETRWAEVRNRAKCYEDSEPRAAATVWARWATSRVLKESAGPARSAFAHAAELWGRVAGAEDQVAEMYFAGQTAEQLSGAFIPEGAEWRPIAAALRGVADTPSARADALESAGLAARVVGQAYEARRAFRLALIEHRRAGNLRGQLFLWHLLAELHDHAEHFGDAVAAYLRCGREDEARRAAERASADDVVEALTIDAPSWQRAASLAALSSVGRRLTSAQAVSLASSVLDQADESGLVGMGAQPAARAVEALAAIIFVLDGEVLNEALQRLRHSAAVVDLRFARPSCEALMLATNCGLSDETETILSVFVSERAELASISSVWVGDRLSRVPTLAPGVREAGLAGRVDALEALSIAELIHGDEALQERVDQVIGQLLTAKLGRDPEGNVVGLASFEGLGIIGRAATSGSVRVALADQLIAFTEADGEPQINRASAANALFNLRSGLSADEAAAVASRLLPMAHGHSVPSRWDASRRNARDPFNRFRLGFMAAADELRAAALHACAALYDRAGQAPTALARAVDDAWPSEAPTVAASAWDALAQAPRVAVSSALEASLVHPAWPVRVSAVRCWAQRETGLPPAAILERLVADDSVAVRIEAVGLARAESHAPTLGALARDQDAYVRQLSRDRREMDA